ncbi:Folate-dependent phosphoribosylglycinamide formyltransferase PurN [Duganella sp. CF458]|uniref:phosphoribosylglycinamide formyltransferase n=1 Tax=Duganella sp. CF458 TaxID=1884368 RepID=UPI0008DFB0C3|nr:formyltransferase family protein [Duganella sp. CF458]SFG21135.1 Folate-dependent phosphoribosylglycinamide formyltransferase PurN [Duganella sp. CF458]
MVADHRKRVVFLCSGGGGNLRFIHQAMAQGWFGAVALAAVITDRECPANAFARSVGIHETCIDFSDAGQAALLAALDAFQPDLVITTVHRILAGAVTDQYRGRLVNLHYSLLPAFGGAIGARPIRDALAFGVRFVGVTVHDVDETLDGGKPLVQAVIPVRDGDDADQLMDLVFRCGCLALAAGVNLRLRGQDADVQAQAGEEAVLLKQRLCMFSEAVSGFPQIASEAFWTALRGAPVSA